jgi:8-oxo-dGTP pyrophosphatase MutT (NUDIX family)
MKIPLTVAAALTRNGKVLLSQRKNARNFDGYYQFVGGKAEKGERAWEAVQREVLEETGLTLGLEVFTLYRIETGDPSCDECHIFVVELPDAQEPKTIELEKQTPWEWIDWRTAITLKLMPGMQSVIESYFSYWEDFKK